MSFLGKVQAYNNLKRELDMLNRKLNDLQTVINQNSRGIKQLVYTTSVSQSQVLYFSEPYMKDVELGIYRVIQEEIDNAIVAKEALEESIKTFEEAE